MRIVDTHASRTPTGRLREHHRAANVEGLGLLAASLVVAIGVGLAVWGRLALPTAATEHEQAPAPALQLPSLATPDALVPLLSTIAPEATRRAVAERLHRRLTDPDDPVEHVGALAFETITSADVQTDRRLAPVVARVDGAASTGPVRLLSPADLAALKPLVAVRTARAYLVRVAWALLGLIGVFWLAHGVRRWRGLHDDPIVLPVLHLLSGLGLMAMLALRDPLRDAVIGATFVSGVCAGLVVLLLTSEIDYESSWLRRRVLVPLVAALGLAVLLLVFGSGPGTSGVKVNLWGAQPVEVIRLLVVFAMAGALARRFDLLRELSEPATPARRWLRVVKLPRWRDVRPVVAGMAIVLAFFFLQKDLGPALVLSGVVLALYAIARGHVAAVGGGLLTLVVAFAFAYAIGYPSTVGARVAIWADPWHNGVPGGNQIAHGLWAMATGGPAGSGLGAGTPQAVPEGHTDFVLAALGEQLGIVGMAAIVTLYALLAWRTLRAGVRAPGDYSALLAIGITLALVFQAFVIAAGVFGLLPLTGVVTPFLSYGRSSMLANCAAVGIALAIARRAGPIRPQLAVPVRTLTVALVLMAAAVLSRAAWVQVVHADTLAATPSLSLQADGGYRFEYNPRLVSAARAIERGSIRDRHGVLLATSRRAEMAAVAESYRSAGIEPAATCDARASRCYPLGGAAFSVLGNWATQDNWAARNATYIERDMDATLRGFDDRQRMVDVVHPRTGTPGRVARRDYSALLPLARYGPASTRPDVRLLLDRPRDVQLTLDARLQHRVARALHSGITRGGHARGAAVVIDVESGDVLASVSHPWPLDGDHASTAHDADADHAAARLDRVRYGLYPPGSTFKLLVAAAALRSRPEVQASRHMCIRLPDGRVGHPVPGWARPVRDDVLDTTPHGGVDLHEGLVVSCNAYFAQLAMQLGPRPILDAVSLFQIEAARPSTPTALRQTLPQAGYGQGDVLVSPLKMARVVATVAGEGVVRPARWVADQGAAAADPPRLLSPADARRLATYMREVVTRGTGRSLASNPTPIAGKTGTAEVDGRPAHSWFVGVAPYGGARPLAIAVVVEHAGYGGRAAASIAGQIVDGAREIGLVPGVTRAAVR